MVWLQILACVLFVLLLVLAATKPRRPNKSTFELERLAKNGDKTSLLDLRRSKLQQDIISIQMAKLSGVLVLFSVTAVAAFGWVWGIVLAALGAISYGSIARLSVFQQAAARLYDKYELTMLDFIEKHQNIVALFRWATPKLSDATLYSKSELEHLVNNSQGVLRDEEKNIIIHSLSFDQKQVKEVMTPRSVVQTLKRSEMLGPLVLDDLHKSGHSRFPVIQGDIDHVVGTLFLRDVLTLDTSRKHTATAETAMDKKVFYINETQTLSHALTAFLKTHHHLFIVVNEFRETVGILTLEDTMEALLGRKIVDEFDAHDDLRAVAARSPQGNHTTRDAKDV